MLINPPIELQIFLPFMIRIILGSLFVFQAYDKLYNLGLETVRESMLDNSNIKKLPSWFFKQSIALSTYIELIGGVFLIVGLLKSWTLVALGLNLIMVSIGFGYSKGLWDMKHVFPRMILLIFLMLIPFYWDILTLDWVIEYFTKIK